MLTRWHFVGGQRSEPNEAPIGLGLSMEDPLHWTPRAPVVGTRSQDQVRFEGPTSVELEYLGNLNVERFADVLEFSFKRCR